MNREEWLNQAVGKLQIIFSECGYQVPQVSVSCGFPSTGSTKHIGQCWARYSSEQDINEIFISPMLDDPIAVLDTLMHELVHAVDNCANGHGAAFKKIALAVGLQGKMRQASAGEVDFPDFARHFIMSKTTLGGLYATNQIYGRI